VIDAIEREFPALVRGSKGRIGEEYVTVFRRGDPSRSVQSLAFPFVGKDVNFAFAVDAQNPALLRVADVDATLFVRSGSRCNNVVAENRRTLPVNANDLRAGLICDEKIPVF